MSTIKQVLDYAAKNNSIVRIKFVPLEELKMEELKKIVKKNKMFRYYNLESLELLGSEQAIGTMAAQSYKKRKYYIFRAEKNRDAYYFYITPSMIEEIEVLYDTASLFVDSLNEVICFKRETIEVGCQTITREDAEDIFKALGSWLGYEISG